MKSIVHAIATGWAFSAMALAAPPTTAPSAQLPEGHPDISAMQQAAGQPELPQGHPSIQDLMKQAAENGLPAGHPQIPAPAGAPAAQREIVSSLVIHAVQGTIGGPAIGEDAVVVELHRGGKIISTVETKLDANGQATLNDLPTGMDIEPVVKVMHAGVEYTAVGNPLVPQHSGRPVVVNVFETTEEQPEWRIKIRHVMIQPLKDGVQVMEMMNVENPGDRTWIGKADASGKRRTLTFPLPKGATGLRPLAGFDECCSEVTADGITSLRAIHPELTQYQISYIVPAVNGAVDLSVQSPASVDRTMMFVPEDGSTVTPVGIEAIGAKPNDRGGNTRYFKTQGTRAGDPIGMTLGNLPQNAVGIAHDPHDHAAASAVPLKGSDKTARMVAGFGTVLILFVGVAFLFKPTARRN